MLFVCFGLHCLSFSSSCVVMVGAARFWAWTTQHFVGVRKEVEEEDCEREAEESAEGD